MSELKGLADNWILLAQGLIGGIGALALAIGHWPITTLMERRPS